MSKDKKAQFFNQNAKVSNKPVSKDNPIIEKKEPLYKKELDDKEIEKQILESLNTKATEFTFEILKPNFWQKLRKQTTKTFHVKKVVFSQVAKMTKIMLDIPELNLENMKADEQFLESMKMASEENILKVMKVISIFLTGDIDNKTVNFLFNNLSTNESIEIMFNILAQSNYQAFTVTTLLTKARTSLQTSAK